MGKQLTKTASTPVWRRNERNSVLMADSFYISYNGDTEQGHGGALTMMGNLMGADLEDGEETALVVKSDGEHVYKILTGDFRAEYEKRWPDLEACLEFFNSQKKEHGNNWSTLEEDRP